MDDYNKDGANSAHLLRGVAIFFLSGNWLIYLWNPITPLTNDANIHVRQSPMTPLGVIYKHDFFDFEACIFIKYASIKL